jgi:hypothetical protein
VLSYLDGQGFACPFELRSVRSVRPCGECPDAMHFYQGGESE